MTKLPPDLRAPSDEPRATAFLRLLVRNHAGVMSHVCGLFARRCFNLDGIVCLPVGDRSRSVILLAVNDDDRLNQLIRQVRKLEDVIDITRADEAKAAFNAARPWLS